MSARHPIASAKRALRVGRKVPRGDISAAERQINSGSLQTLPTLDIVALMLRIAIFSVCLVGMVLPAIARVYSTADSKYSICAFREFANCEELTETMVQGGRFSSEEKRVLGQLKSFTDAPDGASLSAFISAFGRPSVETEIPDRAKKAYGASWLTEPKGECPICGIQAVFYDGSLESAHYSVANRFMIFWYRGRR